MDKLTVFQKYPKWIIEDIKKMAERVGPQAYLLIMAKYGISLKEVNEILKQVDSINGRTSDSKPEGVGSNPARPAIKS